MPDWKNRIVGFSAVKIDDIILNPNNPKEHPEYQKQMISGLINEVGIVNTIIINKRTGHLVDGEGRYWVAVAEDQKELSALWIDVSEEEEIKILGALDTTTQFASINRIKMQSVVSSIIATTDGMRNIVKAIIQKNNIQIPSKIVTDTGLDSRENKIEDNNDGNETDDATLVDENDRITKDVNDSIDRDVIKYDIHKGDIWELADGIFVLCGDCRSSYDVNKLLEISGVDGVAGVFTSPPYAMQRKDQYGGVHEDEYVKWWEDVQKCSMDIMVPDANFFLNIKPHTNNDSERSLYVFDLVIAMKRTWGWKFIEEYCWVKQSYPKNVTKRFKNGFEPVYQFSRTDNFKFVPINVMNTSDKVIKRGGTGTGNTSWSRWQGKKGVSSPEELKGVESGMAYPSNVIRSSIGPGQSYGHEASFPESLVQFFVMAFSDSGDMWFDPFGGSGTVGIVCYNTGRKCIMTEINPRYIAVMINRFSSEISSSPKKVV